MKINPKATPISSSDNLYDLFEGGYIKPESLLANKEDVVEVKDAIDTIREFLSSLNEAGILEEM